VTVWYYNFIMKLDGCVRFGIDIIPL